MHNTAIHATDLTSFLEKCQSYDVIDSAIAVLDRSAKILYQNAAFQNLSTPRNKKLQLTFESSFIFEGPDLLNTIDQAFESQKVQSFTSIIPYNAALSLDVTLRIFPVINIDDQIICVLVTIQEESINKSFDTNIKQKQKLSALKTRIEKLTLDNFEQKSLVKSVVHKSPFGAMIIDANQKIVQINRSGSEILHTSQRLSIGKHCSEFFSCFQLHDGCPVLSHNTELNQEETTTCNIKPQDKILLKSSTKISFDGKPAVLEAFIDITDKKNYERDLLDAILSTEKANMAKSEFLANMSHELRTPLHAILSFAKLGLKKKDRPIEKFEEYFQKIIGSGDTLLKLLNGLLDLSKLEAGKVDISLSGESLNQQIMLVLDEMQALLSEKNLELKVDLQEPLPEVKMDGDKIRQVIRNLVGNAQKFTPENGLIHIKSIADKKNIKCLIENTGSQIPDGELEHIFNKFIQSSTTKDGAGGTGLGLTICKNIIELHKGSIWAEKSRLGAKFTFSIPIN